MRLKKLLACALAIIMCFAAVSCSDNDSGNSSSKTDDNNSVSDAESESDKHDSQNDSIIEPESNADNSSAVDSSTESVVDTVQGEYIKKAYEFFNNQNYTVKMTVTDSDKNVTEVTRIVRGDDFYQLQKNKIGESGTIRMNGKTYDFNKVCGIFQNSTAVSLDNMITSVVDEKLPMTSTHINEDDKKKYNVEEYTYTGDTYITILDFCFDKKTGELAKYTATYSVEGVDDVTEVKEITQMSADIDESVFSTDFINNFTDFNSLTEDQRLGYCQGVCNTAGVTTDEMYKFGIDTDKLKNISYDDFVSLVYTYGYNGV